LTAYEDSAIYTVVHNLPLLWTMSYILMTYVCTH